MRRFRRKVRGLGRCEKMWGCSRIVRGVCRGMGGVRRCEKVNKI